MTILGELRDPWSLLLALASGITVAWFAPWPVAVAVVLAVLAARLAAGLMWPAPTAIATLDDFDRGPGGKLTKRELEVARLVAEHLTNKEIGTRLFIEEGTVDKHIEHIFAKLNFNRRSQVVDWWKRRQAVMDRQKSVAT